MMRSIIAAALILGCFTALRLHIYSDDPIVIDRSPMMRFELHRTHDPTGQQRRLGIIAEGLKFGDGHIAMRWLSPAGEPETMTILYTTFGELLAEQCDEGASVHWLDADREDR